MSCLLHLSFRLIPLIALLSFLFFNSNLKEIISRLYLLIYMKSMTTDRTRQYVSARIYVSSTVSCVLSGLLEGFLLDRRARLQSGARARHLDDFFFFSGCITISLEAPSVHQGHAIHCRECVIGAHHLPSLPGISETKMNLVATLKTNTVISASNKIVIQWSCNECSEMVV